MTRFWERKGANAKGFAPMATIEMNKEFLWFV